MSQDPQNLSQLRHSAAHLLAAAVQKLYPDTKRTIGPATDTGFYYDFHFSAPISEDDLAAIEKTMHELLPAWMQFTHEEVTPEQAREIFAGNEYKLELINEFAEQGQALTIYTCGGFSDLCKGGHSENPSKDIGAFKLLSVAGAYWRGDEKNQMLTRIYGTAFGTQQELDDYLTMMEEAKKRDHRKLGKELGLFMISEEVGGGLPMFYPKGAVLRRNVEDFISRLQEKRGYQPIWIPHITKSTLYEISGHLEKYDALYPPMVLPGEADYYVKPMNCPHFMMLYKSVPHSYRELPLRYVCTTTNYRYEKSGELSGLTRVRALTQDDCHVFMRADQIEGEINLMLDMIAEVYDAFGFEDFWVSISTRDMENASQYIGDEAIWNNSEKTLQELIEKRGWKYKVCPGEAAFYGPKLDFIFKDVIGRDWQLSTIQLDMNLPNRFELEYTTSEGTKEQPVVVHRAILGSTERFLGILIEHYAGAFPSWLAPIQVQLVPVSENHISIAQELKDKLVAHGIRVHIDEANESVGYKIRRCATEKVPYAIVLGDKEKDLTQLSVRVRGQEEPWVGSVQEFIDRIAGEAK